MTKKVTETKYGWYMENEKTKVELEDIVGLVQTDDSTNSVQLKKEAQLSICEKRIIELEKENEQLKSEIEKITKYKEHWGFISDCSIQVMNKEEKFKEDYLRIAINDLKKLQEENEQLKQRNDRQVKQLDRLYRLIEEKDWRTLSDIIDDFKRCEEQLQKEWGTYGDFE